MTGGPFVLAAGGTGGHLFPAEALARELLARGRSVALVTDRRGAAFPVDGVATYRIPAGRSGPGVLAKLRAGFDLARGIMAARRVLHRLRPAAVVGFGGYPSLPTMLAATQKHLPSVIHDQNAVLGRANSALAGRVTRIALSFGAVTGIPGAARAKTVETGNPVRPSILAVRARPYAPPKPGEPISLLILGGSLGARILSDVVPPALLALPEALKARLAVSQQVRREDIDRVERHYRDSGIKIEIRSFFDDVPERLASAHLLICRAGGSTTAELKVAGRPAVLVPYAAAIADEQTANALSLVERDAAWLLPERDFTPEALTSLLVRLLNEPTRLAKAAANAHALGRPDAASDLADLVLGVAEGEA